MKQKFKVLLLLLLVITVVIPVPVKAASYSTSFGDFNLPVEYKSLLSQITTQFQLQQGDFNIIVGKTKSVKPIFPEELDTTDSTTTYESSNTKVASISKSGKFTAKKKGTADITVTFEDRYGSKVILTSKVVVVKNKAELKKQEAIDNMGDILFSCYYDIGKTTLFEIIYPIDRWTTGSKKALTAYTSKDIKSISYKIKDTKIATISKKGSKDAYITGKKKGKTKITITYKDIYGYSYSRTVDIYIK